MDAEPDAHAVAVADLPSGHGDHGRLTTLIAVSIALVSVLGAVVGWRAEVHASRASRYEQDGVAASIGAAKIRSEAEALAAQAESRFGHYQRLGREADLLTPNACSRPISPTDILSLDAGALCSTKAEFAGYNGDGYVTNGRFDLAKYSNDVVAADATRGDVEPAQYVELADVQHTDEHELLWLSLGLVLVLAFFTIARLTGDRRKQLLLAVPGWLCLAAGAVVLVVLEV